LICCVVVVCALWTRQDNKYDSMVKLLEVYRQKVLYYSLKLLIGV